MKFAGPYNTGGIANFLDGSSTFNGLTGRTIAHTLGHTNYRVQITPTANPSLTLGEVWVEKATNGFTVKNSGTFTGAFDYLVKY